MRVYRNNPIAAFELLENVELLDAHGATHCHLADSAMTAVFRYMRWSALVFPHDPGSPLEWNPEGLTVAARRNLQLENGFVRRLFRAAIHRRKKS